jgi:tRNA-dependent cyclodipeptide synthase
MNFEEKERCFLGVSLQNSNFEGQKLVGLVEWISRRFQRCTVLIGDSMHRITLETSHGLFGQAAVEEAQRLGKEFIAKERAVFLSFEQNTKFDFLFCSEVVAWDDFRGYHDALQQLFHEDASFRESVQEFGRSYHSKRRGGLSDEDIERRIQRSSDYFLEEFAICACLQQRGISVMVYPGTFSTLGEIAEDKHPNAPAALRDLIVVSLYLKGRGSQA